MCHSTITRHLQHPTESVLLDTINVILQSTIYCYHEESVHMFMHRKRNDIGRTHSYAFFLTLSVALSTLSAASAQSYSSSSSSRIHTTTRASWYHARAAAKPKFTSDDELKVSEKFLKRKPGAYYGQPRGLKRSRSGRASHRDFRRLSRVHRKRASRARGFKIGRRRGRRGLRARRLRARGRKIGSVRGRSRRRRRRRVYGGDPRRPRPGGIFGFRSRRPSRRRRTRHRKRVRVLRRRGVNGGVRRGGIFGRRLRRRRIHGGRNRRGSRNLAQGAGGAARRRAARARHELASRRTARADQIRRRIERQTRAALQRARERKKALEERKAAALVARRGRKALARKIAAEKAALAVRHREVRAAAERKRLLEMKLARDKKMAEMHRALKESGGRLDGEYPTSCFCRVLTTNENSKCYYFTSSRTTKSYARKCSYRQCKSSYECVGKPTSTLCVRKLNSIKVLPNGYGYCKAVRGKYYAYVPYSLQTPYYRKKE